MPDSESTEAEQPSQKAFIFRTLLGCGLIVFLLFNWRWEMTQMPNRKDLGPATVPLSLEPVALEADPSGPFRSAGAWRITSEDSRVGGFSGLAIDGGSLVALTDNGAVVQFEKPRSSGEIAALVREVPRGPGTPAFRAFRDSEAIVRDPAGRGWWVSFENVNHLWLYDRGFERALQRVRLGSLIPFGNIGFESAVRDGAGLMFISEAGGAILRLERHRAWLDGQIANLDSRISDAAEIGPGRVLLLERQPTLLGFRNALSILEKTPDGYRISRRTPIPATWRDNFEGLAIDRSVSGRTRLWLVSDDSFEPPYRTVLQALDVDEVWLAGR